MAKKDTQNKTTYLSGEIDQLKEDILSGQEKVRVAQYAFAEEIKRGLGNEIKNKIKPVTPTKWQLFKYKIKGIFNKLDQIYG